MTINRPFSVLGIQQIAVGGLDKNKLRHFWVDILGLSYQSTYVSEKENVDEDICQAGHGPFKVCLLYTSPSPRDAHESRMPSSA